MGYVVGFRHGREKARLTLKLLEEGIAKEKVQETGQMVASLLRSQFEAETSERLEHAVSLTVALIGFMYERLEIMLRERGVGVDLVRAVRSPEVLGTVSADLLMIVRRVEALGHFLDTEDGEHLLIGAKRAINILHIEEKKDSSTYDQPPDPKLFKRLEEKALAKAVDEVEKAAAAAIAKEDFAAAMAAMAKLRAPVDEFFDHVTVNASEAALRANRLRLLNRIRATTLTVADFSKIEG